MGRATSSAAINARTVPQQQFGIDPRGWGMFAALSGMHQRGVNGQAGRVYPQHSDDPNGSAFYGYARPQQQFTGSAAMGGGRALKGSPNEIADATPGETSQDSAMRIFMQRLERRR